MQPDYAPGWIGISEVYGVAAYESMNPIVAMSLEEENARKALPVGRDVRRHLILARSPETYATV